MLQELELLEEDSNIYKLIGPVLIKQDPLEAKSNVKKRLEFIQGELDRVDSQLKKLEDKSAKRQAAVRVASTLCLATFCGYVILARLLACCRFARWRVRCSVLHKLLSRLKQTRKEQHDAHHTHLSKAGPRSNVIPVWSD